MMHGKTPMLVNMIRVDGWNYVANPDDFQVADIRGPIKRPRVRFREKKRFFEGCVKAFLKYFNEVDIIRLGAGDASQNLIRR